MNRKPSRAVRIAIALIALALAPAGGAAAQTCNKVLMIDHNVSIAPRMSTTSPSIKIINLLENPQDARTVDIKLNVPVKNASFVDYRALNLRWQATVVDYDNNGSYDLVVKSLEPFAWSNVTIVVSQPCCTTAPCP